MNKPLVGVVIFAGLLAAGVVVILTPKPRPVRTPDLAPGSFIGETAAPIDPLAADPRLATLSIPDFVVTNRDGDPIDQSILDEGYSVIGFIFTNCPFACPIMVSWLQSVEAGLSESEARFVMFSVDPVHDTPEQLTSFGDSKQLGRDRWTLLTGPFEQTRSIVEDGLLLSLTADDAIMIPLTDGTEMANVLHPSRLILVGPQREVLGMYDSTSPGDAERLAARLEAIQRTLGGE